MLKHFLKFAIRFIWRNKAYTLINYLCLTFGLTCAITASLNVYRAFNYDKFHKNYDRLYVVAANLINYNGDRLPAEYLSESLTGRISESVPEIESISRVASCNYTFVAGNESYLQRGIYADENFQKIFSFPLIGNSSPVTDMMNSIIVTERMAIKFFKSPDCLGKTLLLRDGTGGEVGYTVSGVLKDSPGQSSLEFDFIIPFSRFLSQSRMTGTVDPSCQLWVLLQSNADMKAVNGKLKNLIREDESTFNQELFLFPLKDKALYFYVEGRRVWGRDIQYVLILGILGFGILLIACFNFTNLSIALNIKRNREAGIMKVVGAQKSNIFIQYLGETSIVTLLSLLTAIDLTRLALAGLNRSYNATVQFNFSDYRIILIFTVIALFTALVSGILPSIYLSSSNPVNILKGKINKGNSFSIFRQSLIVFQFTIPIVLIILMMIVKAQDNFLRNHDLGFDKNNLLVIPNSTELEAHAEGIRTELLSIPEIQSVSFSSCIPAKGTKISDDVNWEGKPTLQKTRFWWIKTDFNFGKTVNLSMINGRYFDRSFPADSTAYVINDIAASMMGYADPVGRTMTMEGRKGVIIGVFKDFHAFDPSSLISPTAISVTATDKNNLLIKTNGGTSMALSEKIKTMIEKYEPDRTFQAMPYGYMFARTELTGASNIIGLAFALSIILACVGLSALASFTATSRTKEIGIRKINGASITTVMRLLGFNFTRWVTYASLFAVPLSILIGNIFISRFAVRTSLPYWSFLAGPVIAYLVAFIAVGWQCWRASVRNPVEALRYE